MGKLELIIFILILIGVIIYGCYLLYEAITRRIDRNRLETLRNLKSIDMN